MLVKMQEKRLLYESPDWEVVEIRMEESILSGGDIDSGTENDYGEF